MQNVKVGLVGAGTIGLRHIKAIDATVSMELVYISNPAPSVLKNYKRQGLPAYQNAETMFKAEKIDCVIIAIPTEYHYDNVMVALAHHLTVLVEKPSAAPVAQGYEVARFDWAQNRHVLIETQRCYYPCTKKAKVIVQNKQLGTLMAILSQWTYSKNSSYDAENWRREETAGPILTNRTPDIDLLRFIFGDIGAISAEITHYDQKFTKEGAAAIKLKFPKNAVGSFVCSDRILSMWNWKMAFGVSVKFSESAQNSLRYMGIIGAHEFPNPRVVSYPTKESDWRDVSDSLKIEMPLFDAFKVRC